MHTINFLVPSAAEAFQRLHCKKILNYGKCQQSVELLLILFVGLCWFFCLFLVFFSCARLCHLGLLGTKRLEADS